MWKTTRNFWIMFLLHRIFMAAKLLSSFGENKTASSYEFTGARMAFILISYWCNIVSQTDDWGSRDWTLGETKCMVLLPKTDENLAIHSITSNIWRIWVSPNITNLLPKRPSTTLRKPSVLYSLPTAFTFGLQWSPFLRPTGFCKY